MIAILKKGGVAKILIGSLQMRAQEKTNKKT